MRKKDELASPESCLNRAKDDEMIFVLLARDPAAAETIRFWCQERIRRKLNDTTDAKLIKALTTAGIMEDERV